MIILHHRWGFAVVAAVLGGFGVGCQGPQSALEPAGREAAQLATLFWGMTGGAVIIWLAVVVLGVWAVRRHPGQEERRAKYLVIGGGALVPTCVLGGLLTYGLSLLPELLEPAPPGCLRIHVTGEQWWWRVRYAPPEGAPVELANEIRLPVGEPVEFELNSPDVIHSFWIPSLGGKVDMIPGRTTRLVLHPTRTGTFRGVCAEYCGASHALMAFDVVVLERADFAGWLDAQRQPADAPASALAQQGQEAFFANGCAACHAIRGTDARGVVGPELTHFGSRLTIGAGTLPNHEAQLVRWLRETDHLKPGVHMPHWRMLPDDELQALAAYLKVLQ